MSSATHQVPEVLRGRRQLSADDRFAFACHPGVPCFNRCCADVNIVLTPLDVLGLARRLELPTRAFLDRFTFTPMGKEIPLPVVMLRMRDAEGKRCPFVGEVGCTVYEDRPWACRMYPIGMAVPPARAGVEPEPIFFLFEDDFCHGREGAAAWTVAQWRLDQQVTPRDALEVGFREIVSHPWFIGGTRRLDPRQIQMFYTACYDLDTFRAFVFESTFLERFEVEPAVVERIATNDEELMRFGFRWLRYALFGEPTLAVRGGSPEVGRKA